METTEEGEVFFVNVALANGKWEDKSQDKEESTVECISAEEEYALWLIRKEERKKDTVHASG
jgi:hypothetical protein